MEVYYKFESAKDFKSLSIDWHYTTVADLKHNVYYKKYSNSKDKRPCYTDNLIVTNAQTNEEYLDGETFIPKHTSVIIRRVPLKRCMPIVITPVAYPDKRLAENKLQDVQDTKNSFAGGDSSVSIHPEEPDWDEQLKYLSMPEVVPVQGAPYKADEDSKIRALIDAPALDWKCYNDSSGAGRGFGRGMSGRSDRRGYAQGGLLERITPPPGYICHRCNVPGHLIQHCPTNGDPTFDVKRTKPPTGVPKSMLMATQDGSYALPSGHFAVLKPNEDAFEKEIEGMPSTRSVADLPAELYCPLCRAVMKDAVCASKCCFKSFCDKCIRDYIISKSLCFCGATNVLADDLIPNKTLRGTIVRIVESNNSSGANSGRTFQPQEMESARCSQPKIPCPGVPSPTLSATSEEDAIALKNKGKTEVEEMTEPVKIDNNVQKLLGTVTVEKGAEVSEAAQECVTEPGSHVCPPVTDEEMQQKQVSREVGKKRKKKCADLQARPHQDFSAENYWMPMEPFGYSPYWHRMQPEFDGFGRPYDGQMPFTGYGLGPVSIPFGGAFYHDPFGAQVFTPFPSQRDFAELGTDFNGGGGRDMISQEYVPSAKSKINSTPPERHQPRPRSERRSADHITQVPKVLHSSSKRKVNCDDDYYAKHPHKHGEKERRHRHRSKSVSTSRPPVLADTLDLPSLPSELQTKNAISDCKHNASVFSCITSAEEESAASKKRKFDSAPAVNRSSHHRSHRTTSNGDHKVHRKNAAPEHDYESSDDDRHFKRRRSRYESSPSPAVEGRHTSRGLRDKVDYLSIVMPIEDKSAWEQ